MCSIRAAEGVFEAGKSIPHPHLDSRFELAGNCLNFTA